MRYSKGFTLVEVAEPRQHKGFWSKGFTLAEVLITLGIIGVVAALTIPTLISSFNKKIVETRLVNFYSTINNAIELAEVEQGHISTWDYKSTIDIFERFLAPYLKVLKCEKTDNGKTEVIYFMDGSLLKVFDYNAMDWYYIPKETKKYSYGQTSFLFNFYPARVSNNINTKYLKGKVVTPYLFAWDEQRETLKQNCAGTGGPSGLGKGAYCTALIWFNNWKVPDDYPYKF